MVLIATTLYFVITIALTFFGLERQNQGLRIFLISLLLTPIVGIGYLLVTKKNHARIHFYYCHNCDYIFPTKIKYCPICEEKGITSKLDKYISPYDVSEQVKITDLNYW
jgi:uncharacterized paraquat-inducible protein A